jgi:hypothetical protein
VGIRLLVVLAALLLLASGLLKLRAAERVGLGIAVLPLVEVVAALGLLGVSFLRPLDPVAGLIAVVAALALLVVSSLQVGMAMGRRRRSRELSEGARLRTYVQYLTAPADPEGGRSSGERPSG